jgi:hypothetical protein
MFPCNGPQNWLVEKNLPPDGTGHKLVLRQNKLQLRYLDRTRLLGLTITNPSFIRRLTFLFLLCPQPKPLDLWEITIR